MYLEMHMFQSTVFHMLNPGQILPTLKYKCKRHYQHLHDSVWQRLGSRHACMLVLPVFFEEE